MTPAPRTARPHVTTGSNGASDQLRASIGRGWGITTTTNEHVWNQLLGFGISTTTRILCEPGGSRPDA